jgi:CheY-like chemotaxis protein
LGVKTVFDIYLPASKQNCINNVFPEARLMTGKILVMDDEESIRNLVSEALGMVGYNVYAVCDGKDAIKSYQEAIEMGLQYDVVILDLTVPGGMGGEETIKKLIKIKTNIEVTGPGRKFNVLNAVDCSRFDFVLFGGPVWAFSACPVVLESIRISKGLSGKKLIPFATMGFPFIFLGGKQAIDQTGRVAKEMGAEVVQNGVVIPKLFRDYKNLMDRAVVGIIATIGNA